MSLCGGNNFIRNAEDFTLPDVYFNWLLRQASDQLNKFTTANLVTDSSALALAKAIEAITWNAHQQFMLAMFGDEGGEAVAEFCKFLREGGFTIRFQQNLNQSSDAPTETP